MMQMNIPTAGERLRSYLQSDGVRCEPGVSEDRISQFEIRYGVRMPEDFRSYFITMNGTGWDHCYGMISFWSLDDVKSIVEEIPVQPDMHPTSAQGLGRPAIDDPTRYFIFADFFYHMQLYAIHLKPQDEEVNEIIMIGRTSPVKVANNFQQFVDLYLTSPEKLYLWTD